MSTLKNMLLKKRPNLLSGFFKL
uniref:Uncharacterized protein n=1 Tax=Rhizophora mucronata TaxID=61149 RepID=A0A2P2QEM1_RHIMU